MDESTRILLFRLARTAEQLSKEADRFRAELETEWKDGNTLADLTPVDLLGLVELSNVCTAQLAALGSKGKAPARDARQLEIPGAARPSPSRWRCSVCGKLTCGGHQERLS